jgi:glycosyltransferase involved in cell wall biosynthesis
MKLFLVITKGNWGGAQKYVYDLGTNLPKSSFDITIISGQGDILPAKIAEKGIRSIQIPELGRDILLWSDVVSFFKLLKLFAKEKPDIVHLNSSKIGGLGALAARLAGIKKRIFTVHGFAFNEDRPWFQKMIIRYLSWLTVYLSTDVIFISQHEYSQAKNWRLASGRTNDYSKFHLIYNGIMPPHFKSQETAREELARHIKQSDAFDHGKIVVGSIGELSKNKGHCYGLKTFHDSGNLIWVIIGEGEERQTLEKIIKEKNLEHKVFLPGFIKNGSDYLKAFDVLLHPSVKEGVPYTLIEAGYASLPVIATNVGAIGEIITDHESGILINPKDPEAIKSAVAECISNDEKMHAYGEALARKVSTTFSFDQMIEETVKIYS